MAIKYKDIKHKLETDPLSEEELALIRHVEEHVDKEIVKQFGCTNTYGEVKIDLCIAKFEYSPVSQTTISGLKDPRRRLMFNELEKRFRGAGWQTKVDIDTQGGMNTEDYCVKDGKSCRDEVFRSQPLDATHVAWYNK
jgi:hypothetical protein